MSADIKREREAIGRLAALVGPTGMEDGGPGLDSLPGWVRRVEVTHKQSLEEIEVLREAISYALDIKSRSHQDDYSYDDCWQKMRDSLNREQQ